MAMPPGSVIPSEKIQFPAATVPGAAGHWIPDERDGFISWLRSEFAAANAIIDLLCQHLRAIGDPGEYDAVVATIQQRRYNWTPVLHMQQYFPVTDVVYTLQQIAWKRQQQQQQPQPQAVPPPRHFVSDQGKSSGREFRRSGQGFYKQQSDQRGAESTVKDGQNSNSDCQSVDRSEKHEEAKAVGRENNDSSSVTEKKRGTDDNGNSKSSGKSEESEIVISETQAELINHKYNNEENQNIRTGKTFVVTEMYEGKTVNVVEGLELYDKLFDSKEVTQFVSLVNDLRISGKKGQLQGQSYVTYKRPMKGRGREIIQLGLPIVDSPIDDENPIGSSKDLKVEPIPIFLNDVIERLVAMKIVPVKPDACIIDFYNEGDHSHPHMFLPWFGRPVCIMLLSECDVTFGRVIVADHPGDYKGSLKLSLTPGSVLVVQGKSADLSKHAIHSTRKYRIIVTFVKSQPRKSITTAGHNWGPPPSRSPNHHLRHNPSGSSKHYPNILSMSTGVLPTPSTHRPPNGVVQQLFIAAAPPLPMASNRWPVISPPPPPPPRQQSQSWMALPGTGVFLPPGSASATTSTSPLVAHDPNSLENSNNGNGDVISDDNNNSDSSEVSNGNESEENKKRS